VRAFQLESLLRPFTRCRICNSALNEVPKDSVRRRVPAGVWTEQEAFTECPDCKRVFWRGSHYGRLKRLLGQVADQDPVNAP
jgi:uncharacterized protein